VKVERIRAVDVPAQPWKNGGGVMQELLVRRSGPTTGWRVGLAEIAADGPFSDFPGIERRFAVLDGAGVVLTIDGIAHRVTPESGPLTFDGGARTTCALIDGSTQVVNLLLEGLRGRLVRVDPGAPFRSDAAWCGLYARLPGACRLAPGETGTLDVPARTLLTWDPAPEALVFLPADAAPDGAVGYWLTVSADGQP
jgi:hypothetical protein